MHLREQGYEPRLGLSLPAVPPPGLEPGTSRFVISRLLLQDGGDGLGGGIRTPGLRLPKPALYQVEPHPDIYLKRVQLLWSGYRFALAPTSMRTSGFPSRAHRPHGGRSSRSSAAQRSRTHLEPLPGFEPGAASFGGSRLFPQDRGMSVMVPLRGVEPRTAAFVARCLIRQDRGRRALAERMYAEALIVGGHADRRPALRAGSAAPVNRPSVLGGNRTRVT